MTPKVPKRLRPITIFDVLEEGKYKTGDLGGKANTKEFTDAIIDKL